MSEEKVVKCIKEKEEELADMRCSETRGDSRQLTMDE